MNQIADQDEQFAQLINQHLPLVRHIMFQVSVRFPKHVDRTELVRAGVLGLVQAARRYDAAKGIPFKAYAGKRIRGAILDAVRTVDWAPRSLRRSARSVEVVSGTLSNDLGRTPTPAETAAALGISPQQLAELQEQLTRSVVLTLDMAVTDSDGQDVVALGDTVSCRSESTEEGLETRERDAYLHDAVELLPHRHRVVVEGYFFGGRTSEDLAQELAVTVSRISQLRSEAYEMLKDGINFQFADPTETNPTGTDLRSAERKLNYANAIAARSTWRDRLQPPVRAARPMALAI